MNILISAVFVYVIMRLLKSPRMIAAALATATVLLMLQGG